LNSSRACSGSRAHAEHTGQFWRARWACASRTDACAEHTSQELVRAQSAVPSKHTEHVYASGTDAYPEHKDQELLRALSLRISNSDSHVQWSNWPKLAPVRSGFVGFQCFSSFRREVLTNRNLFSKIKSALIGVDHVFFFGGGEGLLTDLGL
jgi:hypothetical protein